MKDKQLLRKQMLTERMSVPESVRVEQNDRIANYFLKEESYKKCKVLFVYVSVNDEISTRRIMDRAFEDGKKVCVPKCRGNGIMEAYRITSFKDLTELHFGIPEPDESCEKILPSDIDLCVVPALCCDGYGNRLGYGGGYYDRFLPKTDALKVILCTEGRKIVQLETGKHDVKCDKIVTEDGVYNVI